MKRIKNISRNNIQLLAEIAEQETLRVAENKNNALIIDKYIGENIKIKHKLKSKRNEKIVKTFGIAATGGTIAGVIVGGVVLSALSDPPCTSSWYCYYIWGIISNC